MIHQTQFTSGVTACLLFSAKRAAREYMKYAHSPLYNANSTVSRVHWSAMRFKGIREYQRHPSVVTLPRPAALARDPVRIERIIEERYCRTEIKFQHPINWPDSPYSINRRAREARGVQTRLEIDSVGPFGHTILELGPLCLTLLHRPIRPLSSIFRATKFTHTQAHEALTCR